jgi:hypothetical protein
MTRWLLLGLLLAGCSQTDKHDQALAGCGAAMQKIGAACQSYAREHAGHYPRTLAELTPRYLQGIPTCPAAGRDTYSAYYHSHTHPDQFDFCCAGQWHNRAVERQYQR